MWLQSEAFALEAVARCSTVRCLLERVATHLGVFYNRCRRRPRNYGGFQQDG